LGKFEANRSVEALEFDPEPLAATDHDIAHGFRNKTDSPQEGVRKGGEVFNDVIKADLVIRIAHFGRR
jgi:hypothetical protein